LKTDVSGVASHLVSENKPFYRSNPADIHIVSRLVDSHSSDGSKPAEQSNILQAQSNCSSVKVRFSDSVDNKLYDTETEGTTEHSESVVLNQLPQSLNGDSPEQCIEVISENCKSVPSPCGKCTESQVEVNALRNRLRYMKKWHELDLEKQQKALEGQYEQRYQELFQYCHGLEAQLEQLVTMPLFSDNPAISVYLKSESDYTGTHSRFEFANTRTNHHTRRRHNRRNNQKGRHSKQKTQRCNSSTTNTENKSSPATVYAKTPDRFISHQISQESCSKTKQKAIVKSDDSCHVVKTKILETEKSKPPDLLSTDEIPPASQVNKKTEARIKSQGNL
jgi:hypothetical protein